jgi:hypothetical protein
MEGEDARSIGLVEESEEVARSFLDQLELALHRVADVQEDCQREVRGFVGDGNDLTRRARQRHGRRPELGGESSYLTADVLLRADR